MAVQNAYDYSVIAKPARYLNARIIDNLIRIAAEEDDRNSAYRVGAVISRRRRIISCGYNRRKTHTKSPHSCGWLHAETDAILRAKGEVNGCTLYVLRLRKDDSWAHAQPCRECMELIRDSGIRRVIFTDKYGEFRELMVR